MKYNQIDNVLIRAEELKEEIWGLLDDKYFKKYIEEKSLIKGSMNELLDHLDLLIINPRTVAPEDERDL